MLIYERNLLGLVRSQLTSIQKTLINKTTEVKQISIRLKVEEYKFLLVRLCDLSGGKLTGACLQINIYEGTVGLNEDYLQKHTATFNSTQLPRIIANPLITRSIDKTILNPVEKCLTSAIHSGLGHTAVNKFLKVMNIPSLSASTFKRYEREMGSVIETVAKESCNRACDEKRALALARLDELRKRLPQGVDSNFLTPDRAHRTNCHINVAKEACAITQDEKPAESVDLAEQQQRL